jgi:2',3'-cyclic-nucleotide 2'-phosphodiesterase (5'-nucleotidase family)
MPLRARWLVFASFLALTAAVVSRQDARSQGKLSGDVLPVLSTADVIGYVTPCGCHTPKGGLPRRASAIDSTKLQYGDAVVVDAGNWAPDVRNVAEEPKLAFLLQMMGELGYDAIGVGERELAFGLARFQSMAKSSRVPILSSNLVEKMSGKPAFERSVIVKKGGLRVGVFSIYGPKLTLGTGLADSLRIEDPVATAQEMVAELRKKADAVVLLAHTGRTDGEDLAAQVPGIDVVILANHPGFVAEGRHVNDAITVASGEQGQNLGITLLTFDGKRVIDRSSTVKILLPEVAERPDVAAKAKEFQDKVNADLKVQQQKSAVETAMPKPGEDHYVGSESCAGCHSEQFSHWQTTQHAHAFATLERVQKDATPECVQCHVVGFGRPSGFENATRTAKLKNVGCEVCHGYGSRHETFVEQGGRVAESVCITCHTPANDPGWNYAAKLPRVSH